MEKTQVAALGQAGASARTENPFCSAVFVSQYWKVEAAYYMFLQSQSWSPLAALCGLRG